MRHEFPQSILNQLKPRISCHVGFLQQGRAFMCHWCKLDCSQLQLLRLSGLGQEKILAFFSVFGVQFVVAGC